MPAIMLANRQDGALVKASALTHITASAMEVASVTLFDHGYNRTGTLSVN
jgi:hypothetical protein